MTQTATHLATVYRSIVAGEPVYFSPMENKTFVLNQAHPRHTSSVSQPSLAYKIEVDIALFVDEIPDPSEDDQQHRSHFRCPISFSAAKTPGSNLHVETLP